MALILDSVFGFQGTFQISHSLHQQRLCGQPAWALETFGFSFTDSFQLSLSSCLNKLLCASTVPCSNSRQAACKTYLRGDGEIRTLDPLLARQVLSQLSYTPMMIFTFHKRQLAFHGYGLKWTRTIDLTLIRRAL